MSTLFRLTFLMMISNSNLAIASDITTDWSQPFSSQEAVSAAYDAKAFEIGNANPRSFFMRVYSEITKEVRGMLERHEFQNEVWVQNLMVNYANLYRDAFFQNESGGSMSPSWALAFAENERLPSREASYQLLMSINAHVNRDLPYALVLSGTDFYRTDLFEDFKKISESFRIRMPRLWSILFEYDHCPRPWLERTGFLLLMNKIMSDRRALAWENGRRLQALQNDPLALAVESARIEDFSTEQVGVIRKSILTRIEHGLCGPIP